LLFALPGEIPDGFLLLLIILKKKRIIFHFPFISWYAALYPKP